MSELPKGKKEGGEKGESGLGSLMNFIPSAYYDLIARVCPGIAFWVAIWIQAPLIPGLNLKQPALEISGPILFILLLLSYVSGIVLTGFCVIWDFVSLICLTRTMQMRKLLGLKGLDTKFTDRWTIIAKRIDEVIKEDENAGRILVKAMAEVSLCQNLLSGLCVLAGIGFFSSKHFASPVENAWYFLSIGAALFVSMVFRQAMFLGRVRHLHAMYVPSAVHSPSLYLPWARVNRVGKSDPAVDGVQ